MHIGFLIMKMYLFLDSYSFSLICKPNLKGLKIFVCFKGRKIHEDEISVELRIIYYLKTKEVIEKSFYKKKVCKGE